MKNTNRKSGFTLVELMVVAAIIAILAAIIVPLLTSNRDRAIAADGQNLLGATASGLKTYYANTGDSDPTISELKSADPLLGSELGKSKYFNEPTATVTTTASSFTYTLTATIKKAVGSFEKDNPLTLDDTGVWGGAVATTAHLNN